MTRLEQREAIAQAIQKRWATVFEDEGRADPPMALADAVLPFIDAARREERQRIRRAIEALPIPCESDWYGPLEQHIDRAAVLALLDEKEES